MSFHKKQLGFESLMTNPYNLPRKPARPDRKIFSRCTIWNPRIPEAGGVYFLFNDSGEIIYVGCSKQMRARVCQHVSSNHNKMGILPEDEVDEIAYLLVDEEPLRYALEAYYQYILNPEFNDTKFQPRITQGYVRLKYHSGKIEILTEEMFNTLFDKPSWKAALSSYERYESIITKREKPHIEEIMVERVRSFEKLRKEIDKLPKPNWTF